MDEKAANEETVAPVLQEQEKQEEEEEEQEQDKNADKAVAESDAEEENEGGDDDEWNGVDQMPSLCMYCGEEGLTKMMIQKVPYFRELIIASFYCEHCCESNNDVTFGGEIQMLGVRYDFNCTDPRDLDRQVIKSDTCSVHFKEIDFEIPPGTQKGEITTIEGMLRQAATNLTLYQIQRLEQMPEVGEKVGTIIAALNAMAQGDVSRFPFTMTLNDPAGNSFLENPKAPSKDINIKLSTYTRTAEQDEELGLRHETYATDNNYSALLHRKHDQEFEKPPCSAGGNPAGPDTELGVKRDPLGSLEKEVYHFPANCPSCHFEGQSLTAMTDIPHFKEVMIMAFSCDQCGYKNSEMKAGGAVPNKGTTVTLKITGPDDMTRDVLKSDSAMVIIPELDLELQHGTLGGVYTTVEGLLKKISESLVANNPFYTGDSSRLHHFNPSASIEGTEAHETSSMPNDPSSTKTRYAEFLRRLDDFCEGREYPFTLEIRDPLGNSFISSTMGAVLPPEMDDALTTDDFTRSWQEDEDFGLNDMNTGDDDCGYEGGKAADMPDRLTHVYPKLPDHPFKFAQGGAGDKTPGGWAPGTASANAVVAAAMASAAPPVDVVVGKRQFSDDSHIEFKPYENFCGVKEGFVFRLGSQGIGYYKDVHKDEPIEWEAPSAAAVA
jgi:zinc finger protein